MSAREMVLGVFLLLLGTAVLLSGPVLVGERPGKWELSVGGSAVLMGAWLVSPDAVGKRLKRLAKRIPVLHEHDEDDA